LQAEIAQIRELAARNEIKVRQLGVFVLFAAQGDAWLLEASEMDGLLLSTGGKEVDVVIVETPETIEVNWSHRFKLEKNHFIAKPYDKTKTVVHEDYPVQAIRAALKGIKKRLSASAPHIIHSETDSQVRQESESI